MAVRPAQEKSAINRMLMSHGLGRLEDGSGLLAQLGFLVQDHEHLRSLLARCEPEQRSAMYDALTPYVSKFKPKTLGEYMIESAMKAEREQLPTLGADGQPVWPKGPAEINNAPPADDAQASDDAIAQDAVNQHFAKQRLVVTCIRCTREALFGGDTKKDAVTNARLAGWALVWHPNGAEGVPLMEEVCPLCQHLRSIPKAN